MAWLKIYHFVEGFCKTSPFPLVIFVSVSSSVQSFHRRVAAFRRRFSGVGGRPSATCIGAVAAEQLASRSRGDDSSRRRTHCMSSYMSILSSSSYMSILILLWKIYSMTSTWILSCSSTEDLHMLTMISLLAMTSEKPKHHVEKTRLPAPYFANLLLRKRPASLVMSQRECGRAGRHSTYA